MPNASRRRLPTPLLGVLVAACLAASACGAGEGAASAADERFEVTIETDASGDRPRVSLEVRPREPWILDMESVSEVDLGEAPAQPASRIAASRILFEVFPEKAPLEGRLRFGVCQAGRCEPVEHAFRVR